MLQLLSSSKLLSMGSLGQVSTVYSHRFNSFLPDVLVAFLRGCSSLWGTYLGHVVQIFGLLFLLVVYVFGKSRAHFGFCVFFISLRAIRDWGESKKHLICFRETLREIQKTCRYGKNIPILRGSRF